MSLRFKKGLRIVTEVLLNNVTTTPAHCSNSCICGSCWQEYTGIVCYIIGLFWIMPDV